MKTEKKYGYYSEQAAKECGTVFYITSGGLAEVTGVGNDKNPKDNGYLWEDAKCIGEVIKYSHKGRKGNILWES